MKNKITILVLLLAFTACKKSDSEGTEKDKIKLAHWLLGNWENKSVEGSLTENWEKVNDSTYKATSFFIKGKDTLHFEFINLQQKGEELTYLATIKGQNEDKPVALILLFRLISNWFLKIQNMITLRKSAILKFQKIVLLLKFLESNKENQAQRNTQWVRLNKKNAFFSIKIIINR